MAKESADIPAGRPREGGKRKTTYRRTLRCETREE